VGLACQLGRQPRLAHPDVAGDGHQPGPAPPAHAQPLQLRVAADQRRRGGRVELRRQLGPHPLHPERGVLAQDRVVQGAQLGRRLDADLVDQRPAGLAIGLQRLGLAAGPVEREHPLRVQALAQRVLHQQRVDLGDDPVVAPGGELGVDGELGGGQPQLLEAPDLGARERLVRHVDQRLAAEQRERLARRAVGSRRLRDQALEPAGVDGLAIDPQLVRAAVRDDLRAAVGGQRLAQPQHVVLDHLGRAGRRLLAPQTLDQPLSRDRPVRLEPEHRQHRALLRAAEGDRVVVHGRLQGSEDADLHAGPGQSNQLRRRRSTPGLRRPAGERA
jgi:hypothetical protein